MTASERIREARSARKTEDWYDFRNRIGAACEASSLGAMVAFEQVALRSKKETRCFECGDPGTVPQPATTYNHVPYWFCDDCNDYWSRKS